MKRLFCLLVLSLFFLGGEIKAIEPIRLGVVVGLNNNKLSNDIFESKIGFHAGIKAELNFTTIAEGVYVDAAALISLKGSKVRKPWDKNGSVKYNPYYIEVPIHIGYKYAVNDKFSILGNFGPYIGYGIMGTVERLKVYPINTIWYVENLPRLDFGLGCRIGIELMKKTQITVGYDYGLGDLSDKYSIQNRNLTLSVAFMF